MVTGLETGLKIKTRSFQGVTAVIPYADVERKSGWLTWSAIVSFSTNLDTSSAFRFIPLAISISQL
jgi:hypothetical protein